MIETLFWILGSTCVVSLISLVGVTTLIVRGLLSRMLLALVGFSAGALIGGSFLHLLPEALEHSESSGVFSYVIVGFVLFLIMENFLYWRHCHKGQCDVHTFTYMNLIGDGVHNFLDGLVIAASFVAGVRIGVVTTLAVVAHEVPQEFGDFGVLVYGGLSRFRALLFNLACAMTAILGALVGYFLFPHVKDLSLLLLPFAAGGFLYVSASDLIPELHRQPDPRRSLSSFAAFFLGLAFMWSVKLAFEHGL